MLGAGDPATLTAGDCLATAHRLLGRNAEAVALGNRVVAARTEALGRVSGVFSVRNSVPEQVRSAMSVVPAPCIGSVGLFEPLVPPR